MVKLFFLCGIQGSGKTTFARNNKINLDAEIVSTDEIRNKFPELEEKKVFPKAFEMIVNYLREGINVIFDATNITKEVRKRNLTRILEQLNFPIEKQIFVFKTDVSECVRRVDLRNTSKDERYLPLEVIQNYADHFEDVSNDEGFDYIEIVGY